MADDLPSQLASTVQAAHIKRDPSPRHDLNPSTAASDKMPVSIHSLRSATDSLSLDGDSSSDGDDDIPVSVLRPRPRKQNLPPMPDLRFEQSYLHSLEAARGSWGRIAWITVRDQVMMPLVQGVLYNLAIVGWQHWNRTAQLSGNTTGARLRRWWYGVNKWKLPPGTRA